MSFLSVCTWQRNASITLSSTITLSQNVTIDGNGHKVTLDGQHSVQVLSVASGVTATLKDLTIANGQSTNGGGINNAGTLTITNSTLSGNSAGDSGA